MFAAILIVATTRMWMLPPVPCEHMLGDIAEAQYAVYRDPTPSSRDAALAKFARACERRTCKADSEEKLRPHIEFLRGEPIPADRLLPEETDRERLLMELPRELFDSNDPREWKAEAVAILVREMRSLDERIKEETASLRHQPSPRPRTANERMQEYYFRFLSRMGVRRAFELASVSSSNAPCRWEDGSASCWMEPNWPQWHFPLELLVYQREWQKEARLSASWNEYRNKRWRETDEQAPHPDLAMVRSILGALDREEPIRPPSRPEPHPGMDASSSSPR